MTLTLTDDLSGFKDSGCLTVMKCCFTAFADPPNPGTRDPWDIDAMSTFPWYSIDVGHSWYQISVHPGGYWLWECGLMTAAQQVCANLPIGFYPWTELNPVTCQVDAPGKLMVGDGGHDAYATASWNIRVAEAVSGLELTKSWDTSAPAYSLYSMNCTDAVIIVGSACGVTVPASVSTWFCGAPGMGYGHNPGDLGEDLKALVVPCDLPDCCDANEEAQY